jgi:hypothetical protein
MAPVGGFRKHVARWTPLLILSLILSRGAAAADYLAGSPGLLCDAPAQIAAALRNMAENDRAALKRLEGCRLVENGTALRILSRDQFVAKVVVGTGPDAATGYMPVQSITDAKGNPID